MHSPGWQRCCRPSSSGTGVHVSLVCPGVVQSRIAQSERNRPSEYPGVSHADAELAERYREAVAASTTTPAHVAAAVLEALLEHRFLVLPSPEGPSMVDTASRGAAVGHRILTHSMPSFDRVTKGEDP